MAISQAILPPYWRDHSYSYDDIADAITGLGPRILALAAEFREQHSLRFVMTEHLDQLRMSHGHLPVIGIFLKDLLAACLNEELRGWLVLWLEDGMWGEFRSLSAQIPLLAFSAEKSDPSTILIPDPAFLGSRGYELEKKEILDYFENVPWENRQPALFWRGASSGAGLESEHWKETPRIKLCLLSKEVGNRQIIDACLSKLVPLSDSRFQSRIQSLHIVDGEVPFSQFLQYRYQLDVDGFSNAWKSCFLKLLSGSVLFKVESNYHQWYYHLLRPWEHYIPVKADLSDLMSNIEWARGHDEECHAIALNARALALSITYSDAMYQYAEITKFILSRQR